MKLDDFETKYGAFELCTVVNKLDHDRLKSYIADKLREFGEELKWTEKGSSFIDDGYVIAKQETNAQIDKELKELE